MRHSVVFGVVAVGLLLALADGALAARMAEITKDGTKVIKYTAHYTW